MLIFFDLNLIKSTSDEIEILILPLPVEFVIALLEVSVSNAFMLLIKKGLILLCKSAKIELLNFSIGNNTSRFKSEKVACAEIFL